MDQQNDIMDIAASTARPATKDDEALLDNLASGQVEELTVATDGQYKPVEAAEPVVGEQPHKQAIQLDTPAAPAAPTPMVVEEPIPAAPTMPLRMMVSSRMHLLHTVTGQAVLVLAGAVAGLLLYALLTRIGM